MQQEMKENIHKAEGNPLFPIGGFYFASRSDRTIKLWLSFSCTMVTRTDRVSISTAGALAAIKITWQGFWRFAALSKKEKKTLYTLYERIVSREEEGD